MLKENSIEKTGSQQVDMIWYLLYPLRGSTQPPRLSFDHPIRRAFYRHGKVTAQHWLVAMLVSVAIAMGFSYPTIFLSENPTAGFAAYPSHVWTTAKPLDDNHSAVDVELRQVWIHGSYMSALDKDVLKSALTIQLALVGGEKLTTIFPTLNEKLRSSTLSWGYHSPLMYWNNSAVLIEEDDDILQTINEQRGVSSSLNVALRPASVFAGKKFDRKKLQAADALVLTLMNKVDDTEGSKWQDRMRSIAQGVCKNCTLFPHDGNVTRNRVYEFSFTPLSMHENMALTFAYSCMALYVLLSLRRMKAFHSRFGLVVTAITQMTCSILSSFTICGILKINLSMIPQSAYPFVVLVIGLENMFRLINAVLAYPATMATDLRIANALGDIGPVSIATAAQNLIILSLLARFVSPGVAAFCAFACIATLFDAFFLLTFFVAVLNVDIRRLELQDAIARSNQHQMQRTKSPSPSRHPWFDALVQGRLPFSTRMAGTAVTTTFILSLNYHFFERHEKASSLRYLLGLAKESPPTVAEFDTFTPPPMNATLTPGEWMRMQDFETAREVMRLAKPGADSFVIRVFAPLVVVLSGADRTGVPLGTMAWFHALKGFAIHHFYPVAVAIVFAVAFVAVLMNFLLYSEVNGDGSIEAEDRFLQEDESLKVVSIALPHKLDIIKLAGTPKGHLVTVALDRSIAVLKFDRVQQAYRTLALPHDVLRQLHWPIREVVLDDNADFLACRCGNDNIVLYSCISGTLMDGVMPYPDDNPAILMQFARLGVEGGAKAFLLVLTSGGRLSMKSAERGEIVVCSLSDIPLLGAIILDSGSGGRKLLTAREDSTFVVHLWNGLQWTETSSRRLPIETYHGRVAGPIAINTHVDLGADYVIIVTASTLVILENQSLTVVGKIDLDQTGGHVGQLLSGPITRCPACGSQALRSIALAYHVKLGEICQAVTFTGGGQEEAKVPICLKNGTAQCHILDCARKDIYAVANAGVWRAIHSGIVLGLRKSHEHRETHTPNTSAKPGLRHRRGVSKNSLQSAQRDIWEAYAFFADGKMEAVQLPQICGSDESALYVHKCEIAVALDTQSIAVAFGNSIKIIKSSRQGGTGNRVNGTVEGHTSSTSKRRLTLRRGACSLV